MQLESGDRNGGQENNR